MANNVEQARRQLGALLRELRQRTGLNSKDFAARLGWYRSKISKLELGRTTPSERDLAAWTQAANAPEALSDLVAELHALETFYAEWRRQLVGGIHARQRGLLDVDAATRLFRAVEPVTIPGVLQTPQYARARFRAAAELHRVPPKVDEAVGLRMRSQDELHESGKRFHLLITEATLRYGLAPAEVMLGQLEKLLVASTLHNLRLGVIPFGVELTTSPMHGFWIFDSRLVLVETFAAELRLTQLAEVALYERVFDRLTATAIYGDALRALLQRIIAEHHRGEESEEPTPE